MGPKNIADRLCTAANDICDHVSAFDLPGLFTVTPSSEQQAAAHLHTESEESKENRLVLIRKTFPHFLDHIHTLSQVSETAKLRQKVVYKFINIFRVLFERICDLAVINAKPDHHRPETTNKRDHGRKTQSAMSSSGERSATPPTVVKLCKLVITLLSNLDPTKPTHKEILEGYLYYLVTRVGKALESFTIGGRPYGIQRDADSFYTAARDAEAFEAQAPYLIWMLNCTQQFSSRISLSTNAIDARIRLQNTLVRGVFGVQANAVFEPALEPPQCPPDDDIMKDIDTQIGAADIRYWFKSEVWRLIGSDVLRKNHVEWD